MTQFITELPTVDKEQRLGLSRAWSRVPNNAHYRIAHFSDFGKPTMTYDYGEMAGAYGLAALVVDKTLTEAKFSLVIFIERPAGRYDIYWIYRNLDLSKYGMNRASGDIFVDYVNSDGTRGVCEIQWDRKQRRWACTGV
jgi:hypothetical protein